MFIISNLDDVLMVKDVIIASKSVSKQTIQPVGNLGFTGPAGSGAPEKGRPAVGAMIAVAFGLCPSDATLFVSQFRHFCPP
jgi:hypothetical protein